MSTEKTVNVAIAGASGAVGEALVEILQERNFPVGELALLASPRSEGKRVQFMANLCKYSVWTPLISAIPK